MVLPNGMTIHLAARSKPLATRQRQHQLSTASSKASTQLLQLPEGSGVTMRTSLEVGLAGMCMCICKKVVWEGCLPGKASCMKALGRAYAPAKRYACRAAHLLKGYIPASAKSWE